MASNRMEDILRHLHMKPELAIEFIAVFSRMEYALKSTKFATGGEKRVEAAWDCFANKYDEKLLAIDEPDLKEAINFLLTQPPRKQVLQDGEVSFIDQVIDDKQKKTQQLILMIRTVRNNLFHGGKYLPTGENEVGRNRKLVESSLIVLGRCIDLDDAVMTSFAH